MERTFVHHAAISVKDRRGRRRSNWRSRGCVVAKSGRSGRSIKLLELSPRFMAGWGAAFDAMVPNVRKGRRLIDEDAAEAARKELFEARPNFDIDEFIQLFPYRNAETARRAFEEIWISN